MHFFNRQLSLLSLFRLFTLRPTTQGQAQTNRKALWGRPVTFLLLALLSSLFLNACVTALPAAQSVSQPTPKPGQHISDIANYTIPTPAPVIVPDVTANIITEDARANIRSGPAIDAPIVAKANPGDTFKVTGKSDDGQWWQICCVAGPNDKDGKTTEKAWVSSVVVKLDGKADGVPVIKALLPAELTAKWQVNWSCGSERCDIKKCQGDIEADIKKDSKSQQYLQVEHKVTWSNKCFDNESWIFEVDRFSGQERSGSYADDFRYNYWAGGQPGPVTNVFTFDDGRQVAAWCGADQTINVPADSGWTNSIQGHTCHDVQTGELVYITYTTRWLYTGQYQGQNYERAYFGDYETLEQYLVDTNADLSYIKK